MKPCQCLKWMELVKFSCGRALYIIRMNSAPRVARKQIYLLTVLVGWCGRGGMGMCTSCKLLCLFIAGLNVISLGEDLLSPTCSCNFIQGRRSWICLSASLCLELVLRNGMVAFHHIRHEVGPGHDAHLFFNLKTRRLIVGCFSVKIVFVSNQPLTMIISGSILVCGATFSFLFHMWRVLEYFLKPVRGGQRLANIFSALAVYVSASVCASVRPELDLRNGLYGFHHTGNECDVGPGMMLVFS